MDELQEEVATELCRGLDEFMASYALEVEQVGGDESMYPSSSNEAWIIALHKLCKIWTALSRSCFEATTSVILNWRAKVVCTPHSPLLTCNWIVGRILNDILSVDSWSSSSLTTVYYSDTNNNSTESIATSLLSLAFNQCSKDLYYKSSSESSFFNFKSTSVKKKIPTIEHNFEEQIQIVWRSVLGKLSTVTLPIVASKLTTEMANIPKSAPASTKCHFLKNFSTVRLALCSSTSGSEFRTRLQSATTFLASFQPYMTSANKTSVRNAAVVTFSHILHSELNTAGGMSALYNAADTTEWTSTLQSLHAYSRKLCGKKDIAASAWDMRISILCIAPNEFFYKTWKDDSQGLLRYHYGIKTDSPRSLAVIALLLKNVLRRNSETGLDQDIMELINTTQAWCFSITKQKSLGRFNTDVLPLLVDITLSIASYNMSYVITSHIRRLIIEGDSIFDERKLVGLSSLMAILSELEVDDDEKTRVILDCAALNSHKKALSDIVGHVLIECNTNFGSELLSESSSTSSSTTTSKALTEYKRALGMQTFQVAIKCVRFLFDTIELKNDQRMIILSQCVIHSHNEIRQTTSNVLTSLAVKGGELQSVVKGLSLYVLTIPDDESNALFELLGTLSNVLTEASAAVTLAEENFSGMISLRDIQVSLIRVEAMCLNLLCGVNVSVRRLALALLDSCRTTRANALIILSSSGGENSMSVADVLDDMTDELVRKFCFSPNIIMTSSIVHTLSEEDSDASSYFIWSKLLATVFPRICEECPLVTASVWHAVNAKAYKLEPVIPALGEADNAGLANIARWRNFATLACATATTCLVHLDDENLELVSEDVSQSAVEVLLKRLCRFLRSTSELQAAAAVLCIGVTHPSAHSTLLQILSSYEHEAFSNSLDVDTELSMSNTVGSSKKHSKAMKQKLLKFNATLNLQWALCRCYKSIITALSPTTFLEEKQSLTDFVDHANERICALSESLRTSSSPKTLMMQQDFCSIISVVITLTKDEALTEKRYQWFLTILGWCQTIKSISNPESVASLDVGLVSRVFIGFGNPRSTSSTGDLEFWFDEERTSISEQYNVISAFVLCRIAFPTLASLLVGPAFSEDILEADSSVFCWIDRALAINPRNVSHFTTLQHFVRIGLEALITYNSVDTIPICLQKCFYLSTNTERYTIATQYIAVLASSNVKTLDKRLLSSAVQVCILHVGDEGSESVRRDAMTILHNVLPSEVMTTNSTAAGTIVKNKGKNTTSSALIQAVTERGQYRVSEKIASALPSMSSDIVTSVLHQLPNASSSIQYKLLSFVTPWAKKLKLASLKTLAEVHSILQLLFGTTHKFASTHGKEFCAIWQAAMVQEDDDDSSQNLETLLTYLVDREDGGSSHQQSSTSSSPLDTSKLILWWISETPGGLSSVIEKSIEAMCIFSQKTDVVFDKSEVLSKASRGIVLLADLTSRYGTTPEAFSRNDAQVRLLHAVLTILYSNIFPTSAGSPRNALPRFSISTELREHCVVIIKNLLSDSSKPAEILLLEALEDLTLATTSTEDDSSTTTTADVMSCIDRVVESAAESLTPEERLTWAHTCTSYFSTITASPQERLFARFSMQVYRLIKPNFDGNVCVRLLALLHKSMDAAAGSDDRGFVSEMMTTLTAMVKILPPFKLVLYPQLLWVCVALLNHEGSTKLHLPTLKLLQAIVAKPTFYQPIIQDVFIAKRPAQWSAQYASVTRAVMKGLYEPSTEPVSRKLLAQMLCATAPGESSILEGSNDNQKQLLINTTSLLPWLCRNLMIRSDEEGGVETALDMAHMWEGQDEFAISTVLFDYASGEFSIEEFLSEFSPAFMAFVSQTVDGERVVFELLLDTLGGHCSSLLQPTLLLIRSLIGYVNVATASPILTKQPVLFSTLSRILRTEVDEETWEVVLSVLASAVSLSSRSERLLEEKVQTVIQGALERNNNREEVQEDFVSSSNQEAEEQHTIKSRRKPRQALQTEVPSDKSYFSTRQQQLSLRPESTH